jgi:hypothetical protein
LRSSPLEWLRMVRVPQTAPARFFKLQEVETE